MESNISKRPLDLLHLCLIGKGTFLSKSSDTISLALTECNSSCFMLSEICWQLELDHSRIVFMIEIGIRLKPTFFPPQSQLLHIDSTTPKMPSLMALAGAIAYIFSINTFFWLSFCFVLFAENQFFQCSAVLF